MPRTRAGGIAINISPANFTRSLRQFRQLHTVAVEEALEVVASELLKDSRLFVPVLTGALKDSGETVRLPAITEARRVMRVMYTMHYAWKQHEVPYWHPSLGFYGAAKFLERPMQLFGDFYHALFVAEYEARVQRLIDRTR